MKLSRATIAGLSGLVLCAACGNKDRPTTEREPERQRRVIEAPPSGVRPLPPHAIRPDGIGPYKLGSTVAELLEQLPSGPRIASFTIPGIVHRDILRAEEDAILIGAEPQGKATFVAVVRGDMARTEAGIRVGSTKDQLTAALGAPVDDLDRAHDARLVIPSAMRNARVVFDGDKISAFVVTNSAATPSKEKEPAGEGCARPASESDKGLVGVCLTNAGDLFRVNGEYLELVARDGEKPIAAPVRIPDLAYALPLRNPSDGRDEIVAIARSDDSQTETWTLTAYRLADGKLVRTIEPSLLYSLTAANARWIGSELRDVDLYLELTSRSDSIEVGGLLTTRVADRAGDKIRDVVVISPVLVPRAPRRAKPPAHEVLDAGTTDASDERSPP